MQISEIYQFHAWLRGISPLIWRRLLVRSDQSVADLHYALQLAFGWSDSIFIVSGYTAKTSVCTALADNSLRKMPLS
jgi:7-keto-8-aminopelargonate synthetase-like enzyme